MVLQKILWHPFFIQVFNDLQGLVIVLSFIWFCHFAKLSFEMQLIFKIFVILLVVLNQSHSFLSFFKFLFFKDDFLISQDSFVIFGIRLKHGIVSRQHVCTHKFAAMVIALSLSSILQLWLASVTAILSIISSHRRQWISRCHICCHIFNHVSSHHTVCLRATLNFIYSHLSWRFWLFSISFFV